MEAWLRTREGKPSEKRELEAWRAAKAFWGNLRVSSIDDETSRTYARERARAANTIRNELSPIRMALKWAASSERKWIPAAPAIILPAMPESEVEHLTKEQFRRFLAACKAPHVALFAQLAILTGARASALLELPWVRVDLERRIINLNPRGRIQPDNKRRAVVPINDQLLPLLENARECAMTPFVIERGGERVKSVRKGFEAASERSGVHCTPHMLRHSAAVWMAEARVPMEEIAAYLGHKNPLITAKVYARFTPDYLQRAASALTF